MRMRRKPYARPELAACAFFVDHPPMHLGRWHELFPKRQPIHIELGCGKGGFIARLAVANPGINYIGIDIKSEVLVVAKRNAEALFAAAGRPVDNLLLLSQEIEIIDQMLSPEDVVERIYINFCNPWARAPQKKRRLTYPKQLTKYRAFLRDGGEIYFKTDDDGLFADSLKYFAQSGFTVTFSTTDLAASDYQGNIPTEHEMMFTAEGKTTKMLIARKEAESL